MQGTCSKERAVGGVPALPADADRALLDTRTARRACGVTGSHLRVLDSWSDFLAGQFADGASFFTGTFRDDYEWPPYTPRALFKDTKRFLKASQHRGRYFLVAERHQWRDVLHVHGLLPALEQQERLALMAMWEEHRGFARLLPATGAAFPYVCKYALKRADSAGDWVDLSGLRRQT